MSKQPDSYVPKDYEDLYNVYIEGDGKGNSLCQQIIRKMLPYGTPEELENLRYDVFLRILEKDLLKSYDPAKANFGGVIFFVTRTIVVNHLSKKERNPLTGLHGGSLIESSDVGETQVWEPGTYSLDRLFVQDHGPEKELDAQKLYSRLLDWARKMEAAPQSLRDRSLRTLLLLMREGSTTQECAESLGVTASTVANWKGILKKKAEEFSA